MNAFPDTWAAEDLEALDEVIDGGLPSHWLLDRLPGHSVRAIQAQLCRRSRGRTEDGHCADELRRRWVGEIGCEALLRRLRETGFAE